MSRRKIILVVAALALLAVAVGCRIGIDPITGAKTYAIDPNAAGPMEAGAEIVAMVGPFLGTIGALIAGIVAGLLAAWRRVKPDLVKAKTAAAHYHASAAALVQAIETFKETVPPEQWRVLKTFIEGLLTKQGIDSNIIENVIRGLRGLPVKD